MEGERGRWYKTVKDVKWYNLEEGGERRRERGGGENVKYVKWYTLGEGGIERRERGR